jgi:type VI protein secretion system component VasK
MFGMHVVVIAWLYVVVMISVVSDSVLKGVVRFIFLGAIPVGLWMWMTIRRRQREQAMAQEPSSEDTDLRIDSDPSRES